MCNTTSLFDKECWENLDTARTYSDNDGIFYCTLYKNDDDNQSILYQMKIMVINEKPEYCLLIDKSNDDQQVKIFDSDIEMIKSKFCSLFHDLTGNFWHYREQFVNVPGHYILSNDFNSPSKSEELQVILSEINAIPKFVSAERAFFNAQLNSIEQTYTYIYDDLNCKINLPNISCEDVIVLSLLSIRKLIIRVGVMFEHKRTIQIYFASGFLLNDRLVLTCANIFDPIQWGEEKVPYKKIYVCYSDPADETLFSPVDPSNLLIAATVIRRGLEKDNLSNYDELKSDSTDLAILALDKAVTHLQFNQYFDPKLNCSSSKSGAITINSKLFLVSCNGELTDDDALKPYRHLKGSENLTIEKLNCSHHVNYKSISIGNLIQESSSDNQYGMHNCTALPGSSGGLIIGSAGQFVGIHVGVVNSHQEKDHQVFFTKETFNKFIPVNSKQFVEFIREAILPNIVDDELGRKWQAVLE